MYQCLGLRSVDPSQMTAQSRKREPQNPSPSPPGKKACKAPGQTLLHAACKAMLKNMTAREKNPLMNCTKKLNPLRVVTACSGSEIHFEVGRTLMAVLDPKDELKLRYETGWDIEVNPATQKFIRDLIYRGHTTPCVFSDVKDMSDPLAVRASVRTQPLFGSVFV